MIVTIPGDPEASPIPMLASAESWTPSQAVEALSSRFRFFVI